MYDDELTFDEKHPVLSYLLMCTIGGWTFALLVWLAFTA